MKSSLRTLIIVNLLAFIAVLAVNYLANTLPLNGKDTGELSDQYPNLIVPAGITFSIWSIIYAWLAVWIVYQVMALYNPSVRERVEDGVEKTGWLFAGSSALNMAWLFAWHYEQVGLSVLIMTALLAVLIRMNLQVGVGRTASSAQEKWMAHPPYGIYQGWITVALVTNVTAFLVDRGWRGGGLSEETWAVLMILVAAGLAIYVVYRTNNVFHGLAVVWACAGIFLKPYTGDEPHSAAVGYTALAAGAAVLVAVAMRWNEWQQMRRMAHA